MIAEREAVAYEPEFDQKSGLKAQYLSDQIDTLIGERLHVLLRIYKYKIKDNLMYGEHMDEPFSDVIKRGIDHRREKLGENRVDKKREEAELEGFLKVQRIMLDRNTPIGTMMLSVSPKGGFGSTYQNNFYDIFTLKEDDGKRFVEGRRYSSALSIPEYKEKLKQLIYTEEMNTAADFLSTPIKVDDVFFGNADSVHHYLHKEHRTMQQKEYERILNLPTYVRAKQRYFDTKNADYLDAAMNIADEEGGLVNYGPNKYDSLIGPNKPLTIDQEVAFYGQRQVRTAPTGCGSSGSLSKNKFSNGSLLSPFSVSEFGLSGDEIDYEFDQAGPCKKCSADVQCGPCGICRSCDLAIRNSQKLNPN